MLPSELPDLPLNTPIALDTETSGLHVDDGARISAVSISYRGEGGALRSFAWPFNQGPIAGKSGLDRCKDPGLLIELGSADDYNLPVSEYRELIRWLSGRRLVLANAVFDLHMLAKGAFPYTGQDLSEYVAWDTMLASWILWPVYSIALKTTARRLWGEQEGDDEALVKEQLKLNKKYGVGLTRRYDLLDWSVIGPYAAKDTELTLRLFEHQLAEFEDQAFLRRYFDQDMQIMKLLFRMEEAGMPYDAVLSTRTARELEPVLAQLIEQLPFKMTAPAAGAWFFKDQGALPHCLTGSNQPSVGECCIRDLTKRGGHIGEIAQLYQRAQKVKNAISKYYDGLVEKLGPDGRLRTDFRQTGTVSFRFSSTRVNLQALPHDYRLDSLPEGTIMPRACFMDEPDCETWEFDLAQAEYRVAGRLAECERILNYVANGIDAHSETAVLLFGSSDFEHRQVAKRANFSLLFSIGKRRFNQDVEKQTGVKLGETRAGQIIDRWRALHPEIPIANRQAERLMLSRGRSAGVPMAQGWVRLADGRQRWFKWDEHSYAAFNQAVQGSIAQGVKAWLLAVDDQYPGMLRLTVHDSIALSIPKDRVDEVRDGVVKIGRDLLTDMYDVPMDVDAKRWKTANLQG